MRALFTVQAGEFLVGDYINRNFGNKVDVWIPAKDRGIDLLITPKNFSKGGVGIQVKSSRPYPFHIPDGKLLSGGWYTIKVNDLKDGKTDFWIFVIMALKREPYFIIVPTKELYRRVHSIKKGKSAYLYLVVLQGNKCYDLRGLRQNEISSVVSNGIISSKRDYTKYLNVWRKIIT